MRFVPASGQIAKEGADIQFGFTAKDGVLVQLDEPQADSSICASASTRGAGLLL